MSYTFACGDVIPGCTRQFAAESREEILVQVSEHASGDHGVTTLSEDLVEAVRGHVREV